MDAKQASYDKFSKQTDTQFIIPVYQRNYDWEKTHCEKLLDDIINVAASERKSHFIGSIVFIHDGVPLSSEISKLTIIDGQQRITTMTLLWLALWERAKDFTLEKLKKTIPKNYIINEDDDNDEKLKLRPTSNNDFILKGLIREGRSFEFDDFSNLIENFNYFYDKINGDNIQTIIEGIAKLLFVEVSLERGKDDPQRIFESLNSTGLDLSQSDLIRNYILIDIEPNLQNKLYENYWREIEKYARSNETNKIKIDDFMRDYLTMLSKRIPNKTKVYEEFKTKFQFNSDKSGLENILTDIKQYAKHYNKLINPDEENDKDIKHNIELINLLEVTVSYPFIMKVYQDYETEKISKDEFIEILRTIQSFVFRRFIVGLGTATLNKIFTTLYSEIDKEDYLNSFLSKLVRKQRSQRFPNNTEIKNELKQKDLYNINSQKRRYLFLQLENYFHKEPIAYDDYSIEHIFPQEPHLKWKSELSPVEYSEMKETHLHTLSNLTLTSYNSKYSNHFFAEKRDMEKGFRESHLFLNKFIATCDIWNIETLNKRYEILFKQFCDIWKYPDIVIDFDDEKKEENIFDIQDATRKKIEYYRIDTQPILISSNKELLVEIVKIFFTSEASSFIGTSLGKRLKLVKNPFSKKNHTLISDSYHIYSALSNNDIFRKTKLVLETFNWTNEVYIKFKEENNEV